MSLFDELFLDFSWLDQSTHIVHTNGQIKRIAFNNRLGVDTVCFYDSRFSHFVIFSDTNAHDFYGYIDCDDYPCLHYFDNLNDALSAIIDHNYGLNGDEKGVNKDKIKEEVMRLLSYKNIE